MPLVVTLFSIAAIAIGIYFWTTAKTCQGGSHAKGCGRRLFKWQRKLQVGDGRWSCPDCFIKCVNTFAEQQEAAMNMEIPDKFREKEVAKDGSKEDKGDIRRSS
jgi:hypothetical protein